MTKTLNSTIRKSPSNPAPKPNTRQEAAFEANPTAAKVTGPTPVVIGTTDAAATAGTAAAEQTPANTAATPKPAGLAVPKPPSKAQQLAAMVVRDEGATLDQMVAALGWLPHTTRAALTGLRKKGFVISSDKVDRVRTYRGIAPE